MYIQRPFTSQLISKIYFLTFASYIEKLPETTIKFKTKYPTQFVQNSADNSNVHLNNEFNLVVYFNYCNNNSLYKLFFANGMLKQALY